MNWGKVFNINEDFESLSCDCCGLKYVDLEPFDDFQNNANDLSESPKRNQRLKLVGREWLVLGREPWLYYYLAQRRYKFEGFKSKEDYLIHHYGEETADTILQNVGGYGEWTHNCKHCCQLDNGDFYYIMGTRQSQEKQKTQ